MTAGKGDKRRAGDGYADGWDRVFGRASPQEIAGSITSQYQHSDAEVEAMAQAAQAMKGASYARFLSPSSERELGEGLKNARARAMLDAAHIAANPYLLVNETGKPIGFFDGGDRSEQPNEDKTCANCKHWSKFLPSDNDVSCQNITVHDMIDNADYGNFVPPADFYCNKWEGKQ